MRTLAILIVSMALVSCEANSRSKETADRSAASTTTHQEKLDLTRAKVSEPTINQRKITAYLLDPNSKKDGFIEKQVDATKLTIQQVFDTLQSKDDQDIAIICKGGYNPQPPYYELTFDLFNGDKLAGDALGMDRNTALHELCMMKAYDHFNLLKANNDPDLKYYIQPK